MAAVLAFVGVIMTGMFTLFAILVRRLLRNGNSGLAKDPEEMAAGNMNVAFWRKTFGEEIRIGVRAELAGPLTAIQSELVGIRSLLADIRQNGALRKEQRDG